MHRENLCNTGISCENSMIGDETGASGISLTNGNHGIAIPSGCLQEIGRGRIRAAEDEIPSDRGVQTGVKGICGAAFGIGKGDPEAAQRCNFVSGIRVCFIICRRQNQFLTDSGENTVGMASDGFRQSGVRRERDDTKVFLQKGKRVIGQEGGYDAESIHGLSVPSVSTISAPQMFFA